MLSLQSLVGVLKRYYAADNAIVCHFLVTKDSLTVIDDPPLIVDCLVQFKQLFALQCLRNLRLLQSQ